MLLESVCNSEIGNSQSSAGKLGPDLVVTDQIDGMLMLDSPRRDGFWYSFLDPLPIDIDFQLNSASLLETDENCSR